MLAADTPPADFTQNALLLAVIVAQLVSIVVGMSGRREAQRRQVSFETEFASREEVTALRDDLRSLDREMAGLKESIVENGERRRIAIESKLDARCTTIETKLTDMGESVSDLARSASATNATLAAWKDSPPWKIRP